MDELNVIRPMIVDLPYGQHEKEDFRSALIAKMRERYGDEYSELDVAFLQYLHYVLDYPTVYVVYSEAQNRYSGKPEYTAYVGETNNIIQRTVQHLETDPKTREDWKAIADAVAKNDDAFRQFVISHPWFNKSLTLDVENRMMHYLSSSDSVKKLNNRRTNAQGTYYTSDQFDRIFSEIWLDLHNDDPELFPTEEIIRDSALFKASPFHKLSDDQVQAENAILTQLAVLLAAKAKKATIAEAASVSSEESAMSPEPVEETVPAKVEDNPKLIFVQGAAGTGKTVLLSHMFYRIATELGTQESDASDDEDRLQWPDIVGTSGSSKPSGKLSSYILVNHKEQVHVYNQIATKLGLQKKADEIVMLPTQFINRFSEKKVGKNTADLEKISGKADIVLIDEAHLLMTQGNQGYAGKNQLYDILRRARIVIAVFDPDQILQARQQWNPETLAKLFPNNQLGVHDKKTAGQIDGFKTVTIGPAEDLNPLAVDVAHIHLEQQFRIAASDAVVKWVDDFAAGRGLSKLPKDPGEYDETNEKQIRAPYEVKVFDSPVELYKAIREKSELKADGWDGVGLSRLLATYDWHYSSQKSNPKDARGLWNVTLHKNQETGVWETELAEGDHGNGFEIEESSFVGSDPNRFCLPWNYELRAERKDLPKPFGDVSEDSDATKRKGKDIESEQAWAEQPHTINEVGSTFTIQGFDLNYAGVIIGPSVKYDPNTDQIVFDPSASENSLATNKRGDLDRFLESDPSVVDVALADDADDKKAFAKRVKALQNKLAITNLRNELNVLLKRGVHGLYLFAVDPELQKKLRECVQ